MKQKITKLMKVNSLLVLLLVFMSFQKSSAQQKISGTVYDEEKTPIPSVNIIIQGTTKGVTTDFDGKYSISAASGDVLEFSYLGFTTKKITVGSQTTIDVTLVSESNQLDEIVVIGYGTSKKKDLTGAVSQVKAESFKDAPVVRVESALQGRASGVSVSGGGQPGDGIKVRIRGVNSITGNNNPLVVVDGVFGGDLRSINPNDIESMEVLKDASALAIYGSRGSNGVILVTTKKGKGEKAKFSLNQFMTVSSFAKSIDRLSSSEFATILNTEATNQNNLPFTAQDIANLKANPIDWEDLITQTGIGVNTQLSVSGRSDKIRYFISGNYLDQEGTQINTQYKRGSLRSNLSFDVNDKFKIGVNVYSSREFTLNNQDAFSRHNGSLLLRAITWDPTSPVKDANGEYVYLTGNANNGWNPVYSLAESNVEVFTDRFNATINGSYQINDNLNYTLIANGTSINSNNQSLRWEKDPKLIEHNFINFNNYKLSTHQISNILNWKKSFNKHNVNVTGVYEFQGARATSNGYNAIDVAAPSFFHGDNGETEFFSNNGSQTSIQSYLGRVQYNFDNNIYLTGSLRVDESSKFSKGNRTGYFPSVAAAYSFNDVSFIDDEKTLSRLKVRAGWGQIGNENVNAIAGSTIANNSGLYSFDGLSAVNGQTLSQIGNPDLKWETTTQFNVGIDFGLFNRFSGSIDYYKKTTSDLLLRTTITGTQYTKYQNIGEVENKGLDFSIAGDVYSNDDFKWNAAFNISTLDNQITELYDGLDKIPGNNRIIGGTQARIDVYQVGEPIGTFNGYTFLGTWKTSEATEAAVHGLLPGDPKYLRDADGELVLGPIGNGLPSTTWGFNNTFTYKNWDLNVFINGASGFDVYNFVSGGLNGGSAAFRDNLSPSRSNVWTPTNETEMPRNGSNNLLNSSRWVEDGSFIRLSNIKLGYKFPKAFKGIENLELYASGQNLVLLTDYSGYDPEVSSTPNAFTAGTTPSADGGAGIDQGAYPNPRTFTIGVKLQF